MNLTEFLEENQIRMTQALLVNERPDELMADMPAGTRHYKITFQRENTSPYRRFRIYYSQGPGIKHDPVAKDVFECLLSDTTSGEYDPFEFMSEFGYTDTKLAKKIWQACVKTRQEMIKFLGEDLLKFVLYEVELD